MCIRVFSLLVAIAVTIDMANADMPKSNQNEALIGGPTESAFEGINEFTDASKYKKTASPVGELEIKFSVNRNGAPVIGVCTATVVDHTYIITAAHCLHDDDNPENTVASAVLWMGFDTEKSRSAPYNVSPVPAESGDPKTLDYAVLRVDGDPSVTFGIAVLSDRPLKRSEELFIISHPSGQRQQLTRRLCRARQIASPVVRHNCHTEWGSSGGPIFSDNDSPPQLVAIHTGYKPFMSEQLNEGALISAIEKNSCIVKKLVTGGQPKTCAGSAMNAPLSSPTGRR